VPRPPGRSRRDQVLAAVVLAASAVEAATRTDIEWRLVPLGLGVVLAGAVLVRRTHSVWAVGLAFAAFAAADVAAVLAGAEPVVLYSGAVVLVLVHGLFRWAAGRDLLLGTGIIALGFTVTVLTDPIGSADALGGAAVLVSAAALGAAIRYRTVAREHQVEQARLHERELLARELHDTVAHHVSAIAIQAQAGLVLARSSEPGGATGALEVIDREAAWTLAEMRAIVGALRAPGSPPSVAPGRRVTDIAGMATTTADAVRVDVDLRGDLADLPPAVEATLYRVAQESVTNARRHAHLATRVEVTVTGSATDVVLTVSDDGAGSPPARPPGYGLVGMSERVGLLGGTLDAGPAADGGWRVRATAP
jgi:signal transduction histidine kinase